MTFEDIKLHNKEFLTAAQVAPLMGCDAHTIRLFAHQRPQDLGFPVVVMGSRVRIPRQGFINFWEGKKGK